MDKYLGRGAEIYLTRVGSRRWLSKEKQKSETSLRWTDLPYRTVIDEAREQGFYFHNVVFEIRIDGKPSPLGGALSRPNILSLSPIAARRLGDFGVARIIEHAISKFELVTDRSRGDTYRPPRAVLAQFSEHVFADKAADKAARVVTDRLRKYPRASIAIIHGNPYVHARIVDLDDSSAFAVLVTSTDRMMVIPQLRSSEPSFSRLLEYIHDNFGEATFVDAPKANA